MKIVFMGTPRAAALSLERLIADGHDIVAVYTQPDRPSGRGRQMHSSPVKEIALERKLTIHQPDKIKTEEALESFRSHSADVAVVVAYGRILPSGFLHAFQYGALNVHFSLLPKYRGAAPVNWAIVNGETQTGVSIIQMNEGLDTGDILLQIPTTLGQAENAVELMGRLSFLGADAISETLSQIDRVQPQQQNDAEATFAPMMRKEDGLIDWKMRADAIERRVRGFQPFPTSYTFYEGSRLTIWSSESSPAPSETTIEPGAVIEARGESLRISCGEKTVLIIQEIQPEGKRRMNVRDFLNGSKLRTGDLLIASGLEIGTAKR